MLERNGNLCRSAENWLSRPEPALSALLHRHVADRDVFIHWRSTETEGDAASQVARCAAGLIGKETEQRVDFMWGDSACQGPEDNGP